MPPLTSPLGWGFAQVSFSALIHHNPTGAHTPLAVPAISGALSFLNTFSKDLSTLGFECTLEEVDLEDITKNQTNTIKACTSEDPGTKCLQGIYEDLNAYRAELKNFNDQKVLAKIDEMMKVSISVSFLSTISVLNQFLIQCAPFCSQSNSDLSLTWMRLCSILHAFRIRTVTINRMMNYLTSAESSL
uniref:Interleukin-12 subunit alpha n=1 Tax=Buteo japonicus TaxID=224669 RepID=A0A8C0BDU6_9AVES